MGALQTFQGRHSQGENAVAEEDEGAQCLILGRSRDASLHGEVVQEGSGFGGGHLSGVATVIEADEGADPVDVGLFGAWRVVQAAENVPHRFEVVATSMADRGQRRWSRERPHTAYKGIWLQRS